MTNISTNAPALRSKPRHSRSEYSVYFALIFAISLPGSMIGWAFRALRGTAEQGTGPLSSALSHARTITPQIFSAY